MQCLRRISHQAAQVDQQIHSCLWCLLCPLEGQAPLLVWSVAACSRITSCYFHPNVCELSIHYVFYSLYYHDNTLVLHVYQTHLQAKCCDNSRKCFLHLVILSGGIGMFSSYKSAFLYTSIGIAFVQLRAIVLWKLLMPCLHRSNYYRRYRLIKILTV